MSAPAKMVTDTQLVATDAQLVAVTLQINGTDHALLLDPRVTLLDALCEHLGLSGTKKGCDHGACGVCTVLVDGQRILSCLRLAVMCEGQEVTRKKRSELLIRTLATAGPTNNKEIA